MRLSVIVPGFGSQRALAETQAAHIRAMLSLAAVDGEVIVADGTTIGMARNNGLRAARGEWIAWVDADDEVTDDWLHEIMKGIVGCDQDDADVLVWDYEMKATSRPLVFVYGREPILSKERFLKDVLRNDRQQSVLWNKLTRRSLWQGLWFDEGVSVLEDFLLWPKLLPRARKVHYLPKVLYRYVRQEKSLTNRDNRQWTIDSFAISQRRSKECGGCADAVIGACQTAYRVVEADALGNDTGDCSRQKAFLRENLWLCAKDRELSWKWKVKYALAAFGLLCVMRSKWRRLHD